MFRRISCTFVFFILLIGARAQLDNAIFRGPYRSLTGIHSWSTMDSMMDIRGRKRGMGIQVLSYARNDEYSEIHNPGRTLIGSQVAAGFKQYLHRRDAFTYLGVLVNYPYGGMEKLNVYPIVQFNKTYERSAFVVGSLHGTTKHELYEPMMAYDLALTQPMEYGIQYLNRGKRNKIDVWLDWRQMAQRERSQQEIISFGLSGNYVVNPSSKNIRVSVPYSGLIYHRGGENLLKIQPIQNQFNGSAGLRVDLKNTGLRVESIWFGSQDFSPQLTHAFFDGFAAMNHIKWSNPSNNHTLSLSHFYGEEYYAPLSNNLFLSEELENPKDVDRYRNFIMLRYQYAQTLVPRKATLDFRIEPIYHLEKQQMALSAALYLKYMIGVELY